MSKVLPARARNNEGLDQDTRNALVQPFLKWAGGKRQLIRKIRSFVPSKYRFYFEPFVGAGALLFELQPLTAFINDANEELINCYRVIKEHPEELIAHALSHPISKKYFYNLRSRDRDPSFNDLSSVERASRIIFLNKTCYNGLFRVNSRGQFNVPFGKYSDPRILDDVVVRAVSHYLTKANIGISSQDFELALSNAGDGDFIYLDPPYDPLSDTSSFTGYNFNGFNRDEQRRLKRVCDSLHRRGCNILLSNSATEFIRKLYSNKSRYTIVEVDANRSINSVGKSRGSVSELLIYNNYQTRKSSE
jgi:DNA adenine methylase